MPFFLALRSKARKSSLNQRILSSLDASTANPPPADSMPSSIFHYTSISHKSPSTQRPTFNSNRHYASDSTVPPAYSFAPPSNAKSTPFSCSVAPRSTSIEDTDFSFLSTFDNSMSGRSWCETSDALKTIAPICTAHDADAIDIHLLNERDNVQYKNLTTPADVEVIFNIVTLRGGTRTRQCGNSASRLARTRMRRRCWRW